MDRDIKKYNELVSDWNDRYGGKCKGIKVDDPRKLKKSGKLDNIKCMFTDGMSEKRKVKVTVTMIGDFASIKKHNTSDKLSRGELARIIVMKGEEILDKY